MILLENLNCCFFQNTNIIFFSIHLRELAIRSFLLEWYSSYLNWSNAYGFQQHTVTFSRVSLGYLHMGGGDLSPLHMGGTSAGGQSVNGGGGTHEGDIDLMGGPNFDRLYHKLKVLLILSCNYMMQFIDCNSIKTCWFVSYRFQIRTITQHQYKRIGVIDRIMKM